MLRSCQYKLLPLTWTAFNVDCATSRLEKPSSKDIATHIAPWAWKSSNHHGSLSPPPQKKSRYLVGPARMESGSMCFTRREQRSQPSGRPKRNASVPAICSTQDETQQTDCKGLWLPGMLQLDPEARTDIGTVRNFSVVESLRPFQEGAEIWPGGAQSCPQKCRKSNGKRQDLSAESKRDESGRQCEVR